MKIVVVGMGYVGLSLATLLGQNHEVIAIDIDLKKVEFINNRICPIKDEWISNFFKEKDLQLKATLNFDYSCTDIDFVVICTPTNYDETVNCFDTSSVEKIIEKISNQKRDITIIIKSTVPVGFCERMRKKHHNNNIIFSPEFLREGNALFDNLYPSRIIVGDTTEKAKQFGELLNSLSLRKDVSIRYMNSNEAEAVKLFSNAYLALRISFFNELDTYAELKNLNSKDIIEGVCLDPRVGMYYNNPSFGYGGYCLPKDTKQLLANYKNVPQNIIGAIIQANNTRKEHIANMIIKKHCKVIGIYRLVMKSDSDNYRESAIKDILDKLNNANLRIIIYEPLIKEKKYLNCDIINEISIFKKMSNIILANRIDNVLNDVLKKVYTRDIFNRN